MYDFGRSETEVEKKPESREETMKLPFDHRNESRNFLSRSEIQALLKNVKKMVTKIKSDRLRQQQIDEERQRKQTAEEERQREKEIADLMRRAQIHLRQGRSVNY